MTNSCLRRRISASWGVVGGEQSAFLCLLALVDSVGAEKGGAVGSKEDVGTILVDDMGGRAEDIDNDCVQTCFFIQVVL